MKPDLRTTLCGIELKNPIVTASGTSGYGEELAQLFDLNGLGAFTAKSITLEKRAGNPNPRIAECVSGMLNSIGLDNDGIEEFIPVSNGIPQAYRQQDRLRQWQHDMPKHL